MCEKEIGSDFDFSGGIQSGSSSGGSVFLRIFPTSTSPPAPCSAMSRQMLVASDGIPPEFGFKLQIPDPADRLERRLLSSNYLGLDAAYVCN